MLGGAGDEAFAAGSDKRRTRVSHCHGVEKVLGPEAITAELESVSKEAFTTVRQNCEQQRSLWQSCLDSKGRGATPIEVRTEQDVAKNVQPGSFCRRRVARLAQAINEKG